MNEITIRGEQAPRPGESEPMLTLSQLQGLLHAAADLERAQRPIVLHTPAEPATVPQTSAPGGIDVCVPAPPVTTAQAPVAPNERDPWPIVFMVSGCTGLASAGTAAATGSQSALLAFFAAVAAWGTAAYQLVFNRA